MSESSEQANSFDEILAKFLAELEQGAERESLIRTYAARYPAQAAKFRELARWPPLLDTLSEGEYEPPPKRLGNFRIEREIAHGGMKTVYEAVQEPLERRVAVATIRRGHVLPARRERFLREQRVLAQLHQTHIVPIFAAGEEGPIQYFAMPYIEGAALHHIIQFAGCADTCRIDTKTPSLKELAKGVMQPAVAPATTCEVKDGREAVAAQDEKKADASAAPPTPPSEKPFLSLDYYRSVAKVLADVAESLQHAHNHGILHRDLKPANIMVDTDEQSWLIDFGLAGYLRGSLPPTDESASPAPEDDMTGTRGVVGTPGYLAPEQAAAEPTDVRTDVWGLGATMYELLTLRRAFPDQDLGHPGALVAPQMPVPPRHVVPRTPSDLESICLKALQVRPDARYQTAGALADDLHRWLRDEPTLAHPARAPRRAYLWIRRNRGWAAAIAVVLFALCGMAVGAFLFQRARADVEAGRAEVQTARADAEAAKADQQRARANERERESMLLKVERLLCSGQSIGWSDEAWDLERQMVHIRQDQRVRNQAAGILAGLDAKEPDRFPEFGAESIVFDPQGQRLLMGMLVAAQGQPVTAKLWPVGAGQLQELRGAGLGPVAFGAGGSPLQLILRPEQDELTLIDLSRGEGVSRLTMPPGADLVFSDLLAVTADGSSVAAVATTPDGRPASILVGNSAAGSWLPPLPCGAVTALAFSPDGSLLAAGDGNGRIQIWSVRDGQMLATLQAARNAVHALAFGRDRRQIVRGDDALTSGWLLATAEDGGSVTIWDLDLKIPRSYCRGSAYDVDAVAFSPDGATLASAGRSMTKIWDVATGRLLLDLGAPCDGTRSLAFSPDGRRLASGGTSAANHQFVVWELTAGRGVTELRGLACPVSRTCFSPDGRFLAALAHNWDVAIWDLDNGFLLHLLPAPRGISADNAALAFSPDGKRFAFSAGREAKAWDVESGRELDRWELYEGFVDQLVYAGPDRLLSLRVETQDGRLGPYSNAPPSEHPRVCRLRELPEQAAPKVIREITDFNWHVFSTAAPRRGPCFVVEGLGGSRGQLHRLLKVYDATGRELATLPTTRSVKSTSASHVCDPTGTLLGVMTAPETIAEMTLFEIPSCRVVDKIAAFPSCLSPEGKYFGGTGAGFPLFRRGESQPVVVFDENGPTSTVKPQFDATGTRVAWGRVDGTVTVAQLPEVERRLAELGLDW